MGYRTLLLACVGALVFSSGSRAQDEQSAQGVEGQGAPEVSSEGDADGSASEQASEDAQVAPEAPEAPVVPTPAVAAAAEPALAEEHVGNVGQDGSDQGGVSEDGTPEDGAPAWDEQVSRTLTTPGAPSRRFAFWEDGENFIKPVLQMSALGVGYLPHSDVADELSGRISTLALTRFGLEGELFGFLTFRSVFERNLGFSLGRNGPVGTSIWEGNASLQARENYVRISKWGVSLTGGIFRDPASVDFISDNIVDAFGMDPYVRDPLLVSGFNQGQGFLASYTLGPVTGSVAFTAGNPLTSSLAFGFGGDVSALGTLFTAPLRALSNGIPGSDIQMHIVAPSVSVEHEYFDVRAGAQIYRVDPNLASDDDLRLTGYNLRLSARAKLLGEMLTIAGGAAYRRNEQLAVPDLTTLKDDYSGFLFNGTVDFRYGDFGVGGTYYWIRSSLGPTSDFTNQYVNIGATYWLQDPNVSVGLRWARSMTDFDTDPVTTPRLKATDSFILSLRLLI